MNNNEKYTTRAMENLNHNSRKSWYTCKVESWFHYFLEEYICLNKEEMGGIITFCDIKWSLRLHHCTFCDFVVVDYTLVYTERIKRILIVVEAEDEEEFTDPLGWG